MSELNHKKKELERLTKQIREGSRNDAIDALDELRKRGWLTSSALSSVIELGFDDLDNYDFSEADLFLNANLFQANLSGANLSRANLGDAILREVDLSDASLYAAGLSGAYLDGGSLERADLREADLFNVNLCGVNMRNADLSYARCSNTVFANVDLSAVIGLETIQHLGPSPVGVDTIYKSKGKIPETFLRGCGVPENLITYLPSLTNPDAIQFYSCFISYSHADKSFAQRLHDTLQGRGIRCWLDEHQMKPGHVVYEEVDRGIKLWDKVILCASQHSLTSWWVDNELGILFEKEQRLFKERGHIVPALIPLDLDGYLFSDEFQSGKKQQIHSRLAADFKGWEHDNALFERQIENVIAALRTDEGRETPPKPRL